MAWTTAFTFVAGSVLTASQMNAYVSSNTQFLYGGNSTDRPAFRANFGAAQSIPNITATTIVWPAELEDIGSGYDPTTGLYTVPRNGLWLFNARSYWAANVTGLRGLWLEISGGSAGESWMNANQDTASNGRANVSIVARVTAGQQVRARGYQSSGGALNFGSTFDQTMFAGAWLAA